MPELSAEVAKARSDQDLGPRDYPVFDNLPSSTVRETEPTPGQCAAELAILESTLRTAYAAKVRRGAMTSEAAWHRLACLGVARRIVANYGQYNT